MPIKITIEEEKAVSIINKISYFMVGMLLTASLFGVLIKSLEIWGIWLGIIFTLTIVYFGFKKSKKGNFLRIVTWGALFTLLISFFAYFLFLSALKGLSF